MPSVLKKAFWCCLRIFRNCYKKLIEFQFDNVRNYSLTFGIPRQLYKYSTKLPRARCCQFSFGSRNEFRFIFVNLTISKKYLKLKANKSAHFRTFADITIVCHTLPPYGRFFVRIGHAKRTFFFAMNPKSNFQFARKNTLLITPF